MPLVVIMTNMEIEYLHDYRKRVSIMSLAFDECTSAVVLFTGDDDESKDKFKEDDEIITSMRSMSEHRSPSASLATSPKRNHVS